MPADLPLPTPDARHRSHDATTILQELAALSSTRFGTSEERVVAYLELLVRSGRAQRLCGHS